MQDFYIYLHRKASDNRPFYVGKGKQRRAWVKSGRNERWKRTCKKHGLVVEILFENLEEQDAFRIERDCILELREFGYDLCNMTDGGEGTSGATVSQETRMKISRANKGRVKTPEWRENMSKSQKGRKLPEHRKKYLSEINTGRKQSEEEKLKRAETLKRVGTCNDRNTYVFYSESDVFVGNRKEFAEYIGTNSRRLKTLFQVKPRAKKVLGWSLLTAQQLLIFKELQNDYFN